MATLQEVQNFLREFITKCNSRAEGIHFINRKENLKALSELEITANERKDIVMQLKSEDYYRGPLQSSESPIWRDYWEFGKIVKGQEVYIKISIGERNKSTLCISFHIARHKIEYPYKNN